MTRSGAALAAVCALAFVSACHRQDRSNGSQASGYVEATEVRIASKVPGRIRAMHVVEGQRVAAGDVVADLDTVDTDLALQQAHAEREQAAAQLRLLQAGARPEDIHQAQAQVAAAAGDRKAAAAEQEAAQVDERRFEQLVSRNAGAGKQRDDAVARRQLADARLAAADDRVVAAEAVLARLKAGARPQEIEAARARVSAADAAIAMLEHNRTEATIVAPSGGVISSRLMEPGELVAPGAPMAVLIDLDHAWASVYVEEPYVPALKIDQPATVVTDAGDRLDGRIAFISPRAEFTPRNVQTADERAKLVYRVKVTVDNRAGILKPGMPVVVEFSGTGR